jgi:hypothetical protein
VRRGVRPEDGFGPIYVVIRLYWPKEEPPNGSWKSPAVRRTE